MSPRRPFTRSVSERAENSELAWPEPASAPDGHQSCNPSARFVHESKTNTIARAATVVKNGPPRFRGHDARRELVSRGTNPRRRSSDSVEKDRTTPAIGIGSEETRWMIQRRSIARGMSRLRIFISRWRWSASSKTDPTC